LFVTHIFRFELSSLALYLAYFFNFRKRSIDLQLRKQYPDFKEWIKRPSEQQLLTAGFPNVLVFILPDNGASQDETDETIPNPIRSAMQQAEATLKEAWRELGEKVLADLQGSHEKWIKNLNLHTWDGWLNAQWQTYWTAVSLGDPEAELTHSPRKEKLYKKWQDKQNNFARPQEDLLVKPESEFLKATYKEDWRDYLKNQEEYVGFEKRPNLNVGSWWASAFDLNRYSLNAVKNARSWQIPTAFGPRSTVSGLGPVVHSNNGKNDWATEGETRQLWQKDMGVFDGIEELNATEVLKRGLHKILPNLLEISIHRQDFYYPDLSSGVAGWLRKHPDKVEDYRRVCEDICKQFSWAEEESGRWGIPWVKENHPDLPHPRLLSAKWLIDDFHPESNMTADGYKHEKQKELEKVRDAIAKYFPPGGNPTDWYVLAAGDGDGMGEWLKGSRLKDYRDYIPEALKPKIEKLPEVLKTPFQAFIQVKKRMGPSTHSALSRALLDFSNKLLPYLTEERYAGRLIYGGGDDVLAYTNLWEWDSWLWDVRCCFQGKSDPKGEFKGGDETGDYWQWRSDKSSIQNSQSRTPNSELKTQNPKLPHRPLFTMGRNATISFGLVIANHAVPLAIALSNLWEAEDEAKDHVYRKNGQDEKKDAVQVRVLYGNGNILKATTKFDVFSQWRKLLDLDVDSALFESAAQLWEQHPAPVLGAIEPWTKAFCSRRDALQNNEQFQQEFRETLAQFLQNSWLTTPENNRDIEVKNWLKLAAFVTRNRKIVMSYEL
jgi:CRISPR-associated protein Cmr2